MNNRSADVEVALVVRALDAGGKAEAAGKVVNVVNTVAGVANVEIIALDTGVNYFSLRTR